MTAEEVADYVKYGSEESSDDVLGRLMECFFNEMKAKFYARVKKHPGESSVTDDKFDWAGQNLDDIEHHLISEMVERFPQYRNRFPELNQAEITVDDPLIEDVDIANLSFVDWGCRIMRTTSLRLESRDEKK
jgi:hypothetical protein